MIEVVSVIVSLIAILISILSLRNAYLANRDIGNLTSELKILLKKQIKEFNNV